MSKFKVGDRVKTRGWVHDPSEGIVVSAFISDAAEVKVPSSSDPNFAWYYSDDNLELIEPGAAVSVEAESSPVAEAEADPEPFSPEPGPAPQEEPSLPDPPLTPTSAVVEAAAAYRAARAALERATADYTEARNASDLAFERAGEAQKAVAAARLALLSTARGEPA